MSRGWAAAGAIVIALALGGCSSGGDSGEGTNEAKDAPSSSSASAYPTPTPTPSPTPPPQVSVKTTCDLIFDTDASTTIFDTVLDFVMRDSNSVQQANKVQEAIDEIHELASSAEPNLGAQMNAFANEAQKILDDAYTDSTTPADTTALRASGLEVANTCQGQY